MESEKELLWEYIKATNQVEEFELFKKAIGDKDKVDE